MKEVSDENVLRLLIKVFLDKVVDTKNKADEAKKELFSILNELNIDANSNIDESGTLKEYLNDYIENNEEFKSNNYLIDMVLNQYKKG